VTILFFKASKNGGNLNGVDVVDVLVEMRRYRMGLIQTADQLRFSYIAIIEGAKRLFQDNSSIQVCFKCVLRGMMSRWHGDLQTSEIFRIDK